MAYQIFTRQAMSAALKDEIDAVYQHVIADVLELCREVFIVSPVLDQ